MLPHTASILDIDALFHNLSTEFTFPWIYEAEREVCQNKPTCMFLGPPAETEKANISLSDENLNSQEQQLPHQHGKELDFSARVCKISSPLLKINK